MNLKKHGVDFVDAEEVLEGDHIHVISMRKATRREREIYFQSLAN